MNPAQIAAAAKIKQYCSCNPPKKDIRSSFIITQKRRVFPKTNILLYSPLKVCKMERRILTCYHLTGAVEL